MRQVILARILVGVMVLSSMVMAAGPVSKQATVIDATSSSEILLEATGIYKSREKYKYRKRRDVRKYGVKKASDDARKAAVYFLLLSGTDPILTQKQEKAAFASIESDFFDIDHILTFITYEDSTPKKKVLINNEMGIRIVKQIKVNRESIILDLEKKGVLVKKETLLDQVGNPFIMVLPIAKADESPMERLVSDADIAHAASVIQSLLTARQFDVVLPDQQSFLSDLATGQRALTDGKEDMAYQLALSVGSDVYIDFDVVASQGDYDTKKMTVKVRAFETTTARLLGAETGYSQARLGDHYVSIEEAMLSALTNVLARVKTYWKSDLNKGLQYKVIVSVDDGFDARSLESVQDNIIDSMTAASVKTKERMVTDGTLDYVLWVDPDAYRSSRQVWRKIRREFRSLAGSGTLSLVNQNRKLLLLRIRP